MTFMQKLRLYHALLAITAIAAYLTGELGIVHAWLGYGVAFIIVLRLVWALMGERQVGLMRFYPSFEGLKFNTFFTHPFISKSLMFGIALSLILTVGTGILIDKGKSLGLVNFKLANFEFVTPAHAEDEAEENSKAEEGEKGEKGEGGEKTEKEGEESVLTEAHELFAKLMLLFVGMHVTYIVIFKLPLAKFMLFLPKSQNKIADKK